MNAGGIGGTLAAVALVVAVGACSGADGDATGDDVTRDIAAEEAADPPVDPRAELEAALLTVDDLPVGSIDLDRHHSTVEICGMRTEVPETPADGDLPTAAAAFALGGEPIVPDVFEKIVVAPSGTGAQVFERAAGHLDTNCSNGGEVDGLSFHGAAELAVPALGDESIARRVTIEEPGTGTTVAVDVLYARHGDTIVALGVVEPDGRTDRLVALATLAFDRATAT